MAEPKTKETTASVDGVLAKVADPVRREECRELAEVMAKASGEKPRVWGAGMIGFGKYRYRYESGREGEWFVAGFAPRKSELSLYLHGAADREAHLARLGKVKAGKGCVSVKRLADIDLDVLAAMVRSSVARSKAIDAAAAAARPARSSSAVDSGGTRKQAAARPSAKKATPTRAPPRSVANAENPSRKKPSGGGARRVPK